MQAQSTNKKYYVYKITNNINGKIYIGKGSGRIFKRYSEHLCVANNLENPKRSYIHRAIYKYGQENFSYEIIQYFDDENEAYSFEEKYINELNTRDHSIGYNITAGGRGVGSGANNPNFGKKKSPESIAKLSASLLKFYETNEPKQKGYKHTPEALLKISQAATGVVRSQEFIDNVTKLNQKITFEYAQEIRQYYKTGEYSTRQLSKIFNLCITAIKNLLNNRTYKISSEENEEVAKMLLKKRKER